MQHLRYAVICEHCDVVDVFEFAVPFTVEGGPYVGDENLRTLQQPEFATLEPDFIPETGEVVSKQVDEFSCTAFSTLNERDDTSFEFLVNQSVHVEW